MRIMMLVLMAVLSCLTGCWDDDDDGELSISINSHPSANPVYLNQEVGFTGSYNLGGSSASVVSVTWFVKSGPGSYVLNSNGNNATGAFYGVGTYVVIYEVTLEGDDGQFAEDSEIDLTVASPSPA
jgi:hypothetical protein